jgi:serine/threonine-protein kinase
MVGQESGYWQAELKITDFGANQIVGEDQVLESATRSLSHSGSKSEVTADISALLDTYDYMAPEQRRGSPANPQSDVYTMGLMMLRLLTGKRELERRTLPSAMRQGLNTKWDDIILTALKERPADRLPNATALLAALKSLS